MRIFSVWIQFGGERKVWHESLTRTNVLQTHQNLTVGSWFLVELIGWKSKNLESAVSVFCLKIIQAQKVIRVPSVGGCVDNEENFPAMIVHRRNVSLQILELIVKDCSVIVVIRMTHDSFIAFVNSHSERQGRGEKEEKEEVVIQ